MEKELWREQELETITEERRRRKERYFTETEYISSANVCSSNIIRILLTLRSVNLFITG